MKRFNVLQSLAVLFVFSQIAWGAVPRLINFQGILKTPADTVVSDGSYSVTFTIYDAATGGNVQWTETQSVTTSNGLFTVLLGSTTPVPDTVFYDTTRYLGMAVSPDPEMIPRQRLSSVGYSSVSSQWTSAGQDLFRLNGNVGIGTASPGAKLDVLNSSIRVGSQFTSAGIEFYPAIAGTPTNAGSIVGVGGSTNIAIMPVGNVGIGTASPTKKLEVAGSIKVGANDTVFSSNLSSNSPLQLQTAGTTRMYIDDATGNVGIGTTSPSQKLHVASPVSFSARFENTSGVGSASVSAVAGAVLTSIFADASGTGTGGMGTNTNHPIFFRTNLVERMRITETGNVGIGTTSPTQRLSVIGNSHFGGMVGIGTTSPTARLHMVSLGDATALFQTAALGGGFASIVAEAGAVRSGIFSEVGGTSIAGIGTTSNHPFYFRTNLIERMRITQTGNVGIGTTSPGASNLLELSSTTKGFVLSRMTKTERDAIASPVAGMMVYQTDNTPGLRVYNGTNWMRFTETAD